MEVKTDFPGVLKFPSGKWQGKVSWAPPGSAPILIPISIESISILDGNYNQVIQQFMVPRLGRREVVTVLGSCKKKAPYGAWSFDSRTLAPTEYQVEVLGGNFIFRCKSKRGYRSGCSYSLEEGGKLSYRIERFLNGAWVLCGQSVLDKRPGVECG